MRFSPDADAHSLQHKTASRSAHIRQTVFLLALLLAGLLVSIFVVRYLDPPKTGAVPPDRRAAGTTGAPAA